VMATIENEILKHMRIKILIAFVLLHVFSFSQEDTACRSTNDTTSDTNIVVKTSKYIYGKASYYAGKFIGRRTANGEIFTSKDLTCAHMFYKFGTRLRITNLKNGKSVIVRVNDRGKFDKYGRYVDLSHAAFTRIASTKTGVIKVKIENLGKA
jgi:rare lipoprotein A